MTLLLGLLLMLSLAPAAQAGGPGLPSRAGWEAQTRKAMAGSMTFVRARVADRDAGSGERLALNLDIDNTALATRYAPGTATAAVLRIARYAAARDVAILFNTARPQSKAAAAVTALRDAGYRVDALCTRPRGRGLSVPEGKQYCRRSFTASGYTIIANIGNSPTDFTGGGYERAYRLPNYGGRLK